MVKIIKQGLKGLAVFVSAMMLYACTGKTPQQDPSNIYDPLGTTSESRPLISSDQIPQPLVSGSTEEDLEEKLKIPSFNEYPDGNACDEKKIKIKDVFVVSDVNEGIASSFAKTPTIDDSVNLFLVLKAESEGRTVYFSEADEVVINGKKIPKEQIRKWDSKMYGAPSIRWYKVEPIQSNASNTEGGWHWDKIDYCENQFSDGRWKVKADVNSSHNMTKEGKGTMRFKVAVGCGDVKVSSPGNESYGKTGIKDIVHRISVRGNTGNEILDWAESFMNLPYIWGSASPTRKDNDHQTENYQGGDCADFVVAASRKAGAKVNYGGSGNLFPNRGDTRYVAKDPMLGSDGIYRINGKKVEIGKNGIRLGDVVVTKGHAGLFSKDLPPIGYLSYNDQIMHTLWEPVKEESIQTAMLYNKFHVVRFKQWNPGKRGR